MLQTKVVDKIWALVLRSIKVFFLPPERLAFYKIMWKNIVQPDRPNVTM